MPYCLPAESSSLLQKAQYSKLLSAPCGVKICCVLTKFVILFHRLCKLSYISRMETSVDFCISIIFKIRNFTSILGTAGNPVTNSRAYSICCRPPSLLTGSSTSVSTTGSGSSHHHSRHKSRFIDIPRATTASGTSGTGTGSQASSFRYVISNKKSQENEACQIAFLLIFSAWKLNAQQVCTFDFSRSALLNWFFHSNPKEISN